MKVGNFIPKYTTYGSDGNGRDGYITYNNGGFLKEGIKIYSGSNSSTGQYTQHFTAKNVAPFRYYSDGSGRDSYVLLESGGLVRTHRSLKQFHLKDFLRY
jgi:hypothetical protein